MARRTNSQKPPESDARTALDELAAIFWRAAAAELVVELEQEAQARKRRKQRGAAQEEGRARI